MSTDRYSSPLSERYASREMQTRIHFFILHTICTGKNTNWHCQSDITNVTGRWHSAPVIKEVLCLEKMEKPYM